MTHAPSLAPTRFTQAALADLRSRLLGQAITPEDEGYDQGRSAWNLAVDQHPALIVLAESAQDVVAAVQFAAQADLGVAVQSTGHGNVRPADDCLLIVTARMQAVQVNAQSQTARIEAGVKWGRVLELTSPFGLAPLLGSSPGVGAIGYTLGGGMGWLARKYGLAADSVRYFEAVTSDGRLIRVDQQENADLFWGLRGGGGSLAIVTAMEVQLTPVTTVYGGNLLYPIESTREVFQRYRDWIATAPDELTSSVSIMHYPPLPQLAEPIRGRSFAIVRGCFCGPVHEGEALLRFWRDWQMPVIDAFQAMPFAQVAAISQDPIDPLPGMSSGAWLRDLSDETINTIIQYSAAGDNGPSPLLKVEIRHAGGAINRIDPASGAYSHREASLILQSVGLTPSPEAHQQLSQHNRQFRQALAPHLTGGVYMNFLEGQESRKRVREGFSPEAYARLTELKSRYDPHNRLGFGFNITPST